MTKTMVANTLPDVWLDFWLDFWLDVWLDVWLDSWTIPSGTRHSQLPVPDSSNSPSRSGMAERI
jgi:hypothetical protein